MNTTSCKGQENSNAPCQAESVKVCVAMFGCGSDQHAQQHSTAGTTGSPNKRQGLPVHQVHLFAHAVPDASKLQRNIASADNNNGPLGQVRKGQGLIGCDGMFLCCACHQHNLFLCIVLRGWAETLHLQAAAKAAQDYALINKQISEGASGPMQRGISTYLARYISLDWGASLCQQDVFGCQSPRSANR